MELVLVAARLPLHRRNTGVQLKRNRIHTYHDHKGGSKLQTELRVRVEVHRIRIGTNKKNTGHGSDSNSLPDPKKRIRPNRITPINFSQSKHMKYSYFIITLVALNIHIFQVQWLQM